MITIGPYQAESDQASIIQLAGRLADSTFCPEKTTVQTFKNTQRNLMLSDLENLPATTTILVARNANKVIGFIQIDEKTDWLTLTKIGHIDRLAIAEDFTEQGIATKLLAAAEEVAKNKNYHQLTLMAFNDNVKALKLYEKIGFKIETVGMVKKLDK
ncbi:ribosomal protein S18 acetylase RimI-like enzyme [Enterococcus sp. PF1-24]|uniref:GNAT family N-acetyltransferase n=1 Tax=unclassified Enterococcus TaxID=2608891 RepID=UPI002474797D|nr:MULTISPECIES: GNAT family N-acetyltransferase [unclassified Enterococcus]MDH6363527.1 ribosomal protein S18 acetylase RimI-like enzyme [Enterococcus sp. PFB1-1]MDH6400621.1 ribosomal protein S18 acetylase RimI-like enzyme [Enterococcus sp. PF1-24]